MTPVTRKRRRRKDARPLEILQAAAEVYAERGFAGTSLDEVARRADVAKGTIYLYYETKLDLFRMVLQWMLDDLPDPLEPLVMASAEDFGEVVSKMLMGLASEITSSPLLSSMVHIILSESRSVPELGEIWHQRIIAPIIARLTELIVRAQAVGTVRPGSPYYYAFSLLGPLIMGDVVRIAFPQAGDGQLDIVELARQHTDTILRGMLSDAALALDAGTPPPKAGD